jgi:mono/diheme cytochrome c family protein
MKNILIAATAVIFVAAAGFVTLSTSQTQPLPFASGEAAGDRQDFAGAQSPATAAHAAKVQRGEYLVKIMGCNDCHTPWKMGPQGPEPDVDRFLSGHPEQIGRLPMAQAAEPFLWSGFATNTAFSGPWGVSYAFNLTPEQNTGLGIWTEDMFVQTIRTGRHMGVSRPINPPMPWPAYRNATDDDLKAVYAYLRTIKPIVNHVPEYQPPQDSN